MCCECYRSGYRILDFVEAFNSGRTEGKSEAGSNQAQLAEPGLVGR